jgi:hypothetical protein
MNRVASLSIDLDDLWAYQMIHGDPSWTDRPSYLATAVPRALQLFADHRLSVTWFIVGFDATVPANQELLASVPAAGHDIGNHSFLHEPWLHRYHRDAIEADLTRSHEAIVEATGVTPTGFRGPGYTINGDILSVLITAGYRYDASSLPTYIGPLARWYYFRGAAFDPEERRLRSDLYGHVRDGLRPLRPHRFQDAHGSILEIPVTTLPWLRAPFHFSYLLYLSGYSERAAAGYLRAALRGCSMAGIGPSLLLHPLDLIGADDVPDLAFFPGMGMPGAIKRQRLDRYLAMVAERFDVVAVGEHADRLRGTAAAGRTIDLPSP